MLRASLRALHIGAVASARAGISTVPKAMGKNVYAVVAGRRPGLYKKWEDCLLQVKGFPGNRYKVNRRCCEARLLRSMLSPPYTVGTSRPAGVF